jgi:DNA-binding NarL/FixJ family response regulator
MTDRVCALLVVKPGPLRDALRTLIDTIPQIATVQEAQDRSSAMDMVAEYSPDLVLLDAGLPNGGAWLTVKQIKDGWPQSRCVVMTDTCQQVSAAKAAGADILLLKGLPPAKLVEIIERLLTRHR